MNSPHESQNSSSEPTSSNEALAQGNERAREYVQPTILSHSGEEILEDLGPAQACYPFGGGMD